MQDEDRGKEQLIAELQELRRRVAELERDNAARKQAEGLLRARLHRFYSVLSNLHAGVLLVTEDGRVEFANKSFCDLFGLKRPPEELRGLSPSEFIERIQSAFADPVGAVDGIQEILDRGLPVECEEVALRDGRTCLRDFTPLYIDGKRYGRLWHHQDITERKRAEEMLRRTEENFRRSLEESPLGVRIVTMEGETIYANRAILNIYGYDSIEELKTTPAKKRYTPESYAEFRIRREIRKKGNRDPSEYEISIVRRDGEIRHLQVVRKDILWDGQRQFQVIYQDITERKRMEKELRVSESKYRVVADNTFDWEYWVDEEGRFPYISPSCQRITGYSVNEFEKDPELFFNIVHPDDRAHFEAHLKKVRGTNAPDELEFRIISRDGETRWIGHACQPVFNVQGRYLGSRASNRDITGRKQVEKALEESSEKLKLFAYSVAHDLKSPTIGVYGLTKRLSKHARDVLDEKGKTYCDQIMKVSEHIAALVDKINVYIATKEARLSIETIDIADILHMLKEEFLARLSIRRIDWLQPETRIEIKTDRLCMLRAFRNFVDNSLKYGGESLSKIWTGYEDSEDFHVFSFSDNGKGLKAEDSEKIFGAFQRNETSRGVEGAGLGLTIVKEIAEQHGGKVWVQPRSKKGITFYLSISKNL